MYNATTLGFSVFAISAEVPIVAQPPSAPVQQQSSVGQRPAQSLGMNIVYGLVMIIILLGLLIYFARKKKKSKANKKMNITKNNFNNSQIDNASIEFKVNKSRISANNITPSIWQDTRAGGTN